MDYSQTLVIVLAIALSIFLVLAIVAVAIFIKILISVRHVMQQAATLGESLAAVGEAIKKTAVPSAVGGMVAKVIGSYVKANKNSKSKGDKDE